MPFESSWSPNFSFRPTPLAVTSDVTITFSGLSTNNFNFDRSTTVCSLFWQSAPGRPPLWWCGRLSCQWKEEAKKIIALDLTAWYLQVWVTNATGECITVPDSTSLAFPKQSGMIMMAGLGGIRIVCCLLTHEILSTGQNMLADLQKLIRQETQGAASAPPIRPAQVPFPDPRPTAPSHDACKLIQLLKFWRFLSRFRKRSLILDCQNLILNLFWYVYL